MNMHWTERNERDWQHACTWVRFSAMGYLVFMVALAVVWTWAALHCQPWPTAATTPLYVLGGVTLAVSLRTIVLIVHGVRTIGRG